MQRGEPDGSVVPSVDEDGDVVAGFDDELLDLGWTDDQVEELEAAVHAYVDFARCVQSERRYRRDE